MNATNFLREVMSHELFVTSVSFREDALEISFLENREQGEHSAVYKTIVVSIEADEDIPLMYSDIQSLARDIVDRGYVSIRNPPKNYSSGDIRDTIRKTVVESREMFDETPEEENAD